MERKYTIIDGELYHAGVKGMKWGVRKKKENVGNDDNKNGKKPTLDELNRELKKQKKIQRGKTIAGVLAIGALGTLTVKAIMGGLKMAKGGMDFVSNGLDAVSDIFGGLTDLSLGL